MNNSVETARSNHVPGSRSEVLGGALGPATEGSPGQPAEGARTAVDRPVLIEGAPGAVPVPALVAAAVADEKLGRDTVVLAMGELLGLVDAFVVTSGRNVRQVRTLVEEIERRVKRDGGPSPSFVEGLRDGTWVLMDYGDFVVHVFLDETREYYDLEHLWSSAPRVPWAHEAVVST